MLRLPWSIAEPGHFETDLVHHCGPTASGEYAYTLQMIDVDTGWSERRAVLGRSYLVMEDAFLCFLVRLPFPVQQIHPDNAIHSPTTTTTTTACRLKHKIEERRWTSRCHYLLA
jgi:hypothetical protein